MLVTLDRPSPHLPRAPILFEGRLWGPANIFQKYEIADHRREAILWLLQKFPGQQIVQIVERLQDCEWVRAPKNKDLVKADMQILEKDGLVERRGNTRKWQLVEGKGQPQLKL